MSESPGWLLTLVVLGPVLLVAAALTLARPLRRDDAEGRVRLVGVFLIGIASQCVHMIEEFVTGFTVLAPSLMGFGPMSHEFFVGFNVTWLGVWSLAAYGALRGSRIAYVPIWFFALGMGLNGVIHPLLALRAGGYFPGLVTSPVVGIMGLVVITMLFRTTLSGAEARQVTRSA